jgi:inner membrane protein
MDPFSHGVLGATVATLSARQRAAFGAVALCGTVAGMAPDLDVLIKETGNPMLGLAYHRHFTHALAFVPVGALVVAGALWLLFMRRWIGFGATYVACLLGMAAHGPLDAMTNYGTHLFWPFTDRRESWNIISIIDPIFTITLLVLLITTVIRKSRRYVVAGIMFAALYWSAGYYQREQATDEMVKMAVSRGHTIERYEVKPSFANILAWRTHYQHQGRIYVDAVHTSPWHGHMVYDGSSVPLYTPPADLPPLQQRDLEYFTFFSDGWVALSPTDNNLISDMRFAMLPNQITPLWGIRLQPEKPDHHVLFEHHNRRTADDTAVLWAMITGQNTD